LKGLSRRQVMKASLGTLGILGSSSAFAQAIQAICGMTPPQPEGPFYPINDQLDKDNDLTQVKGRVGTPLGQVIYVQGQVLDRSCHPVPGALVEVWQACASGKYNHPGDTENPAELDPNFQYWGRNLTDSQGRYLFKTILPGEYPADVGWIRPPHLHFKIQKKGFHELITQMYFAGNPYNSTDRILQSLSQAEQERVVVSLENPSPEFDPISKVCTFNVSLRRAT
jgi:protocatechuate 3,4-dioxygenase, beta subunit